MRVFDIWLEGIKSNTPKGLIDLRRENIGDSDLEDLGAALQNNNIVWYIQLSKEYIVNSGEFKARNDGATPISNRRATSDGVTNFP